jgi:hypothetical protein
VIVFMGVALVAFALAIPELERLSGGAIGIVLLGVSVLTSLLLMVQRRRESAEARARRAAAWRSPRVRWLMAAVIAFTILVPVLAAVLGRMASR